MIKLAVYATTFIWCFTFSVQLARWLKDPEIEPVEVSEIMQPATLFPENYAHHSYLSGEINSITVLTDVVFTNNHLGSPPSRGLILHFDADKIDIATFQNNLRSSP